MKLRRASYRRGVEFIALNDEPTDTQVESVSYYTTSLLLAELFGVEPERVGKDVVRYRQQAEEDR